MAKHIFVIHIDSCRFRALVYKKKIVNLKIFNELQELLYLIR